jgi:glycosyltransferase involved in cell wall biosynthesis
MVKMFSINENISLSELKKNLPRLLLVSEASLDSKRTGLNRTLLNLFKDYPADRFMIYTPDSCLENHPTSPPIDQNVAAFPERFIPRLKNRLGLLINPLIDSINYQLVDWLPITKRDKIATFAPEIILLCPVGTLGLLIGNKVAKSFGVPFIAYFMDDWANNNHQRWLSGGLQSLCRNTLEESSAWLMVSSQLEKELMQRYQIESKNTLIVHNPVDLSDKTFPNFIAQSSKTFKVAYAGSIFTMHYDALAIIAEAIYALKQDGVDIELLLYTDTSFWDLYQENWQKWEVKYGSLIPYEQLNQYLQQADLLLVASSFLPEYEHVTRLSVQTKLTDYMASGRPILTCGPSYAACNQFIEHWNCGLVCKTNQIETIKKFLLKQIQNYPELESLAREAFAVVNLHFESRKVISNLYQFIQKTALDSTHQ